MQGTRVMLLFLLATALACRSGKTVPEDGAVLLHVKCAAGAPLPDELFAWVYDDAGRLWEGVRIPAEGPLVASGREDLGTILIQPGAIQGRLRVHLRAFAAGARIMDGVLVIESLSGGDRIHDLVLEATLPVDEDGDDVPDAIDDCPAMGNPAQGGCPGPGEPDAGPDAGADTESDGPVDSAPQAPEASGSDGGDARVGGPGRAWTRRGRRPGGRHRGGAWLDGADLRPLDAVEAVARDAGDAAPDAAEAADAPGRDGDAPAADAPDTRESVDFGGPPACDGDDCKKPQGSPCRASADCTSAWCADGVCCTNACLGPCRSCNQPTSTGVCQGYPAGSDPQLECPTSSCNGVGACGPATSNLANGSLCNTATQCASGFCADGVCCDGACDQPCQACGTGACLAVKKTDDVPECTGSMTCNPTGKCVTE